RTAALLTLAAFTGPARNPDLLLAAAKGDRETAKTLLAQGAENDAREVTWRPG
ncbi:MAG: hypothetical protein HY360_23830, partial [Verrucomicrobia bacterium]|nr:hypothetical protein [Verrucomicrobiota bacterium]